MRVLFRGSFADKNGRMHVFPEKLITLNLSLSHSATHNILFHSILLLHFLSPCVIFIEFSPQQKVQQGHCHYRWSRDARAASFLGRVKKERKSVIVEIDRSIVLWTFLFSPRTMAPSPFSKSILQYGKTKKR